MPPLWQLGVLNAAPLKPFSENTYGCIKLFLVLKILGGTLCDGHLEKERRHEKKITIHYIRPELINKLTNTADLTYGIETILTCFFLEISVFLSFK